MGDMTGVSAYLWEYHMDTTRGITKHFWDMMGICKQVQYMLFLLEHELAKHLINHLDD